MRRVLFALFSVLLIQVSALAGNASGIPDSADARSKLNAKLNAKTRLETATFAAGCFWGTEEFFRKIPGVVSTRVGYAGGHLDNPKYQDTHGGKSGHAEAVELQYDPSKVSYGFLLDQFFKMHDPTTLNRQGNDVGSEYRSAIFAHSDEQLKEALAFKTKVEKSRAWKAPITTEISSAPKFWVAEDYHQQYIANKRGTYDNHYLRNISFDSPDAKSANGAR